MKPIVKHLLFSAIAVAILGTLWHFFYNWSNKNVLVGLFAPINESTWEHMKLIFFPMMLVNLFYCKILKKEFPNVVHLLFGTLVGTWLIPILFYSYSGILGYTVTIINLATYYLSVILAYAIIWHIKDSCWCKDFKRIIYILCFIQFIAFLYFTYNPGSIAIFVSPT